MALPLMPEPPASAPAVGAADDRDEHLIERHTLRDYYVMIRERLWIALPAAVLVALPLGYYQMHVTPMFESRATMQFERPDKIVMVDQVMDQTPRSEIDINTYLQRLNSASLRAKVVESLTPAEVKVLQRPYLQDLPPGAVPPSPAAVLGTVYAESVHGSLIILITARHRDPEAAALVANRFYEQFVNYLMAKSGGSNEEAVAFLQRRALELQKEYEEKEHRLQEYKKAHNLISLDDSLNIVTDRLKSVNAARTTAHLDRLNLEVYFNQVQSFRQEGRDLLEISYVANHGTIPGLKAKLAEATQTQSVLSERYLERHPRMIEVAQTIKLLRDQMKDALDLAIADLTASLDKARQSERSLEAEYARQEQEQVRLDDLKVEYHALEDQAAVAKNAYTQVLDSLNKTTTAKGLDYHIPVSLLDRATPGFKPYSPNAVRVVRTGVLVGLAVFFGVAFGLNLVDDRIKSAWDIESFIGAPLLGIIPDLGGVRDEDRHQLAIKVKATPGVEAFLSVYSAVKIQSKLDYPKIILVTSTIPGEGKTLISCNLAGAFARHGRNTLLVDCDLRRPMLHRHFGLANDAGLLAWAEAGANLQGDLLANPQLGVTKIADSLFLLRSGGHSKTPTEFLENPVFGQFLEQMKRRFDLIVIDSPPVAAVSDSLLIAEHSDELIYVCRFNRAYRKHVRQFVRMLRDSNNVLLGIVLNGLSPRRIEYYTNYRYYRSYKKYYGTQA